MNTGEIILYICTNPKQDKYCNECKHSKPHELDYFACHPKCEIGNCKCVQI